MQIINSMRNNKTSFISPYYNYSIGFKNDDNLSADKALDKLSRGNQRFMLGKSIHPHSNMKRVSQLKSGQKPFVATLSCSDSRVSPSIIFDQGLGDIFQVRNAGNVLDKSTVGSLEYAVEHLGVNLIVVMGHDDCGAVKASLNKKKDNSIYINSITHYIYPSVNQSKYDQYDLVHSVAAHNAINTANKLSKQSKIISNAIRKDGLKVVPAMYDVESGYVNFYN